ncbi:DMT family transporter [Sporolactobacillus sp. KGMB 08714]|uniref:DMT family transporter n=1 Tax=Sporolactobacillus sp. KGMB 08714 TaxID=3064704 RepID=UPI002FBE5767
MKKYLGDGMMLVTASIWGSGFVVTDIALKFFNPYQTMAGRFVLATFLIIIAFYRKVKKISRSVLWKGALLGTCVYTGFILQTVGLQYTTPSKNAFLTAVNVVIVPIIAFLIYRRRIDRYEMLGSMMALVGIGFMSLQNSLTVNIGDVLSLACAAAFAFEIFFTNIFVHEEDSITLTIVQFVTASLLSVLTMFLTGGTPTVLEKTGMLSIFYLAVFSTAIAYLLQNIAQSYTTSIRAAIILSMESFFGMLFSIIFLHELVTARMILGAVLILASVLLSEIKPSFKKKETFKRADDDIR